jgi:hypothetical protein
MVYNYSFADSIDKTWSNAEELFPGVWVYRDVFTKDLDLINRLDKIGMSAEEENVDSFKWTFGFVGYSDRRPDYRDCHDIKVGEIKNPTNKTELLVANLWNDLKKAQINPVTDYCTKHSIKMTYWEVMNCIRYIPGQHFQEHADDGFSYSATVSLVGYPNDDYTGGELSFPKLGLTIKPKAGDLYIFPSTYIFSHIAQPVQTGTKYSVVTMLDYNDHAHNPEFMQMRQRWVQKEQAQGQNV